jgi:hypothetical protein
MAIMSIEQKERDDDSFVYLPSLGKVRRISSAQRADAFLGSDLTFGDLERLRVEDYVVESMTEAEIRGEEALWLRASRREKRRDERVEFGVARTDWAILEVRYLKRDTDLPWRRVEAPRESMKRLDGHVLPTRLIVHNAIRETTTEVILHRLEVNPQIADRDVSLWALEHPGANGSSRGSGIRANPGSGYFRDSSSGWAKP